MIVRKDIAAHLDQSVRIGFTAGQRAYTPLRTRFTELTTSTRAFELFADFGARPWPVQNGGKLGGSSSDGRTGARITGDLHEGAAPTILGIDERAVMVYPADWEVTVGISHNAIDDDQTGDLESWARDGAINFNRHMDYICFAALNAGDAATYGLCYDGLNLFSNTHADPGAQYTTAQDNLYGLTLSLDNFKTVKIAGSKFLDGRGQPQGMSHNLLIVPSDLEYEGSQIVANPMAYDTGNNERNPYANTTQMLVAPGGWLDTTSWFLMDVTTPTRPIRLVERKAPSLVIWDEELTGGGGTRYYKWHARYNVVYGDWRLVVMGNS